jgi:orotate phosphoribosyltransferase-like protein
MTKLNIIFANDVNVSVDAKVKIDEHNDTIDIHLDKIDAHDGKITLSYCYNYSRADHRRIAISDDVLDKIATMLKQGFTNRQIADKLDITIESVYQVRMARSKRYKKKYDLIGGWPNNSKAK